MIYILEDVAVTTVIMNIGVTIFSHFVVLKKKIPSSVKSEITPLNKANNYFRN